MKNLLRPILRWALFVALVPPLVAGLYALGVTLSGLARYDPAYFTAEYAEVYAEPGPTALALEQALRSDDQTLLAELQGRRRPAALTTSPSIIFVMLWEFDEPYITYMYLDMSDYHRYPYYFREVNGRWVASSDDAIYYWHSGRWIGVWAPLAFVWWLVGAVALLGVLVYRLSARLRKMQEMG